MKKTMLGITTFCFLACSVCHSQISSAVFDFEAVELGTNTPFSITNNAVIATFRSLPEGEAGFQIDFSDDQGQWLQTGEEDNQELVIQFSQLMRNVTVSFSTVERDPPSPSVFSLKAFKGGLNGSLVGEKMAVGISPSDYVEGTVMRPRGNLIFEGKTGAFDTLHLSIPKVINNQGEQTSALSFSVDNIVVIPYLDLNPVVPGDLNNDGKVDIRDAILSLQIAVGFLTPNEKQTTEGDLNGDRKLNVLDSTLILQKAVGL